MSKYKKITDQMILGNVLAKLYQDYPSNYAHLVVTSCLMCMLVA